MHTQSVGSQAPAVQTQQRSAVDTARVDEKETSKIEEQDANQTNKTQSAAVQIKDSNRGTSVNITG